MYDRLSARCFMPYPEVPVPHAKEGPLTGLTFAVKDIFDVAGYPTSAGNPTFLALQGIKQKTASCVEKLLAAGAEFQGKTITDELAFSMQGANFHFGAPINGGAPDRYTGGSSSGSASAVSCGLVDFALGSDTGGSIRCPASQCGVIGLRPTFGRAALDHCQPLSKSFDTVGFFARRMEVFEKVAAVLYGQDANPEDTKPRLIFIDDIWTLFGDKVQQALKKPYEAAVGLFGSPASGQFSPQGLERTFLAFRKLQTAEAWESDGSFIETYHPVLGPGVRERFILAKQWYVEDLSPEREIQAECRAHLTDLLKDDGLAILPTMPDAGIPVGASETFVERFRQKVSMCLCHGGLSGFPWISLPLGTINGAPIGISLVGPKGRDLWLIAQAAKLMFIC